MWRLDEREDLRDGDEVAGADIKRAWSAAAQAAQHDRSLLIRGETGAGKERVAKLFHEQGPRARGPLVASNCAEIREDRAEADLFGHKRAAYTGAVADRAGAFERAHGGTLFFDEIGELSLEVQAKLLRALQERTIRPVGGDTPKKVETERSKKVAANDARVNLTVQAFDGSVAAAAEHLKMPVSSVDLALQRHAERKK